ncbi:MarR family transcriptional regulator [Mycobacterium talmoniae]|nr:MULTISPECIES: MarR family transcriptional regulator [Mycobacterium]OHU94728.1 transcriptional regulator [Mycobacterium talmoniae]TDH48628.1 MarR family transcriptional regulator [Mycobacterium eburneum]
MKTKAAAIAEISALIQAVGDKFDSSDVDAERDFMAQHCPPRLLPLVHDIPTLSIHLLDHITEEPINLVELAARSGQLKGTVSKHVQRLVEAGLVQRSSVPGNRKEIALSLSADGQIVALAHRRLHEEMNRGMQDFLSRYTRAELATVTKILGDLLRSERVGVRLVT